MSVILFIVFWILFGLLSVFLGGVVDRLLKRSDMNGAETMFLVLGPITLFVTVFVLGAIVINRFVDKLSVVQFNFLKFLVRLGRGR